MYSGKQKYASLLLAAVAISGYYVYSRMDPEQKKAFVENLKARGRHFFDHLFPSTVLEVITTPDPAAPADSPDKIFE